MPYDPQWPQNGQNIDADRFRGQFSSLIDLINQAGSITAVVVDSVATVPAADPASVNLSLSGSTLHFSFGIPRGQDGASATPITSFIVDGVNTLNPGDPATVQTSFDGASVRFTFGIPRGNDGTNGSNGSDGGQGPPFTNFIVDGVNMLNPNDPASVQTTFDGNAVRMIFNLPRGFTGNDGGTGSQGGPGPPGPPFANAVVDSVTTLNPGDNATVQTNFDGSNVRFQFGIPRGQSGNDGGSGTQGPPGEVTNAQLSSAIGGTSSNSNAVSLLDTPFTNDPPTLADLELMRANVNELITALRR